MSAPDAPRVEIEAGKIQAPTLRDETLRRDRLLDWLDAKIHHRLILVIAEAGYGKTTLLADFSRRTRLRTLWYRLDETDADWVTVLRHLVAAGRQGDPAFASATWSLLGELGTGGTTMAAIVATFIRELQSIGDKGAVLVLDDYHLVEGVPELEWIVREVVHNAPERLSVVLLSRHRPTLPVARLRALGEVAELGREELRFNDSETERLFRETYGRPLDPDIVAELGERTQGWAASLQLVRSALRDPSMSETRAFVKSLTGARGTIHDFLAEEVVGDLDPGLQSFLMRTSILSALHETTAAVAAGIDPVEARGHMETAARLGLLPRADSTRGGHRYHPLVRDFLEDRLRREIRSEGIVDLHRTVARFGETADWKLAAHHYTAAIDLADLHRVLVSAMQDIMSGGDFALAESYVRRFPELESDPTLGLFLSRRDAYNGDFASAVARAQAAVDANPASTGTHLSHLALANLATMRFEAGDYRIALEVAGRLHSLDPEPGLKAIARGTLNLGEATTTGDLDVLSGFLNHALGIQAKAGHEHYRGITRLNLACHAIQRGRPDEALHHSAAALELLSTSSAGSEIETLLVTRAHALLMSGSASEGWRTLAQALDRNSADHVLAVLEAADVEGSFGSLDRAMRLLGEAGPARDQIASRKPLHCIVEAELLSQNGAFHAAMEALSLVDPNGPSNTLSLPGRWNLVAARVAFRQGGSPGAPLAAARRILTGQRASYWLSCVEVLDAASALTTTPLNDRLDAIAEASPIYLTICADDVIRRLGDLNERAIDAIQTQAAAWPTRWLRLLRASVESGEPRAGSAAARILDRIGEQEDVSRLRVFARASRRPSNAQLGRGLARRIAPRCTAEDLGHVRLTIGQRNIDGSEIRRKVLSLICLLLTRPGFAATRDQVLEALWPDFEPSVALNSLNQTVYFLRRVFEPKYRDDESAGYVHHDGEVVRLDTTLVSSQSARCRSLADQARQDLDPFLVDELVRAYVGRFAIDFEYEDWASPFRETLHAAFLDVVEQAVSADFDAGQFERSGRLARRALDVDPEAQPIEAALLRAYRGSGSHAAAAEQHSHYVTTGLEVDP